MPDECGDEHGNTKEKGGGPCHRPQCDEDAPPNSDSPAAQANQLGAGAHVCNAFGKPFRRRNLTDAMLKPVKIRSPANPMLAAKELMTVPENNSLLIN